MSINRGNFFFREKEGGVWKKVEDKKGYTYI